MKTFLQHDHPRSNRHRSSKDNLPIGDAWLVPNAKCLQGIYCFTGGENGIYCKKSLLTSEYPQVGTRKNKSSSRVLENSGVEIATKKVGRKMIRELETREAHQVVGGCGAALADAMAMDGTNCLGASAYVAVGAINGAASTTGGQLAIGTTASLIASGITGLWNSIFNPTPQPANPPAPPPAPPPLPAPNNSPGGGPAGVHVQ